MNFARFLDSGEVFISTRVGEGQFFVSLHGKRFEVLEEVVENG